MKCLFILFCVLLSHTGQTQTTVQFQYDNEGNQISREICVSCRNASTQDSIKTVETLTADDLIKDERNEGISYYPNPVLEELYVRWTVNQKSFVTHVALFTMTGQQVFEYKNLANKDNIAIGFQRHPQGFYNLVLYYNTGDRKTLKVLKK